MSGKIAIVASRFNEEVVERLISGAEKTLQQHGFSPNDIELFRVPGAFEIPFVCHELAKTKKYLGIIPLGAVIRGESAHFEYVAKACTDGILQAQLQTGVPMSFGVLTTYDKEQAKARATDTRNMGSEAAEALLEVISIMGTIR